MRAYAWLTMALTIGASAAAAPPPIPATPAPVADLVSAGYFTLEQGYPHYWSKERFWTTTGTLLVLKVDPALVIPREIAMPVLYVGDVPAWRLNRGHESGHVIAVVPGKVDLTRVPIWYGAPDFPQNVDAATARAQRDLAERAGIQPLPAEKVQAALAAGGEPISAVDQRALLRDEVAELILKYSPQEKHLADAFRVPVLQRSEKSGQSEAPAGQPPPATGVDHGR